METTAYTHLSIVDDQSLEAISLETYDEETGDIMTRADVIEVYLDNGFELQHPVTYYSYAKDGQIIVDTFVYQPVEDTSQDQQPRKTRRLSFARIGDNMKNIVQEELGLKDQSDKRSKY